MAKHGKRYTNAHEKIERGTLYELADAVKIVKDNANTKFDETIEVAMNLGVDPRHADQMVRGTVALPHGTGKDVRVLVLANEGKQQEARDAGADHVGLDDMATKIQKEGWTDFDVVIATPDVMAVVGRLGRVLGPRGLMPNPKSGTVTMDLAAAIAEVKAGTFKAANYKEWTMMAKGGASLAPYYEFDSQISADVKAKVAKLQSEIMSGSFTVEINDEEPKSTF